jgi:hypothetical protein
VKPRVEDYRELTKQRPDKRETVENYASYAFSWSGDGLQQATRTRGVVSKIHNLVAFDVLIQELRWGKNIQNRKT